MQRNILEYLDRSAQRVPDKVAFYGETETLTFRQLQRQARSIGTRLARLGSFRKPVAVFMDKEPKTIAAFLGVLCSGGFYVPLDREMPRFRIEKILESLRPMACICDESTFQTAQSIGGLGTVFRYEELAFGAIDEGLLDQIRQRQIDTDPAYIVFTSGSTGVPKGVVGCHRAVIDYMENLCPVLGFDEHTVFGNQTPLYFDACLKEIIPTLKYGASTHLIPRKYFLMPVKLVQYLNERKINTLCWVVSALTCISSFHTFETVVPKYLKTIAFASEVFPIRQLKRWRTALPNTRFINLYGPTETTGICCWYEVDREFSEEEALPIGRPFPNTEIILLDEHNRAPGPGEQGEICIRGTRLTHGYFANPEKTAEAFVQNPLNPHYPDLIYRTGDIGCYNDRGELMFVSRKDNQIKHMGHRIELGEIEAAANTCSGVGSSCCVYDGEKQKITLFYTGEVSGLRTFLKEKLPRYMLPHHLVKLDAMPLTPNGKIDRNLLKQRSKEYG